LSDQSATVAEPLAATVIGGYLGAGKTTLVNQLLRHANGLRLAILVNEFGALPIDEDLIEAQSDDLISIAGGCICCSFGSDLTAALMEMAKREPRPDHVVIESSGVAMPAAIGASIGLLDGYFVAGIVVLADTETVREHAADEYLGDTTLRQLRDADLIVQTKTDLVAGHQRDEVDQWLRQINARAAIVPAEHGRIPIEVALGQHSAERAASEHADHAYESRVIAMPHPVDPESIASQLSAVETGVIRAKGFVRGEGGDTWLIQTVGKRWQVRAQTHSVDAQLVCIGLRQQLDWPMVDKLLQVKPTD